MARFKEVIVAVGMPAAAVLLVACGSGQTNAESGSALQPTSTPPNSFQMPLGQVVDVPRTLLLTGDVPIACAGKPGDAMIIDGIVAVPGQQDHVNVVTFLGDQFHTIEAYSSSGARDDMECERTRRDPSTGIGVPDEIANAAFDVGKAADPTGKAQIDATII